MKSINKIWKRIAVILFFYLINFGLWELIASIISDEWASFMVYVTLFFNCNRVVSQRVERRVGFYPQY